MLTRVCAMRAPLWQVQVDDQSITVEGGRVLRVTQLTHRPTISRITPPVLVAGSASTVSLVVKHVAQGGQGLSITCRCQGARRQPRQSGFKCTARFPQRF